MSDLPQRDLPQRDLPQKDLPQKDLPESGLPPEALPPALTATSDAGTVPPLPLAHPPAPAVAVIMGSQSDWPTMRHAAETLGELGVAYEARIVSAHRTPERLYEFARTAKAAGFRVIIAGAGGAAHLPGMTAAITSLPVFGVPVETKALGGQDSLFSIVQMPAGIPVGTLAIGRAGAVNAALLAAAVLGLNDTGLAERLDAWRAARTAAVADFPADEG